MSEEAVGADLPICTANQASQSSATQEATIKQKALLALNPKLTPKP